MPGWTSKDRRKYEHIKESELERGVGEEKAEEIAGRTVNKSRRKEGRTPNRKTMGTGNPTRPLAERTRDELYNMSADRKIAGRSHMRKEDLVRALQGKG